MPPIQIHLLPDLQRPLADKFYRAHASGMRPRGQVWVARQREIVGALCLSPVNGGQWLTGLFIAPDQRGKSIARQLLASAVEGVEGYVWLFCDPQLVGLYRHLGFAETSELPQVLADRLARYRQSKTLVALVLDRFSQSS